MTIFFDNCIPRKLVTALQLVEFDVIHLQEIWPDKDNPGGVDDETWIPDIGNRGFVVVSGDHRLTTKPSQVIALERAGLIVYIVYRDFVRQLIPDQARWLFRYWHNIEHHACTLAAKGHAYEVRSDGNIKERSLREAKRLKQQAGR